MILNQIASGGGAVTLDGDAAVGDVLAGKTFYNTDPDTKLTGTLSTTPVTPLVRIDHSGGVTVTADATAHTKGAWAEVIASTTADADMLVLNVYGVGTSSTNTATLIDLAVGAAGSEAPFLSNLAVGAASGPSALLNFEVPLPVAVAAGSRISARIQSVVADGKTATVRVATFSGGTITPGALTVMGASTSTSDAVNLGTGWTEISASTAATYRHLIVVPSAGAAGINSNGEGDVTLGSGASGAEATIGTISVATNTTENLGAPNGGTSWAVYDIFPGVTAGTRLVLKRAATLSAEVDGAIIGVT